MQVFNKGKNCDFLTETSRGFTCVRDGSGILLYLKIKRGASGCQVLSNIKDIAHSQTAPKRSEDGGTPGH